MNKIIKTITASLLVSAMMLLWSSSVAAFNNIGAGSGEGSTKLTLNIQNCGKQTINDIFTVMEIEASDPVTEPYNGFIDLTLAANPSNILDLQGLYIESKPGRKVTMTLLFIQLFEGKMDALVQLFCPGLGGYLLGSTEFKKFEGKLDKNRTQFKVTVKGEGKAVIEGVVVKVKFSLNTTTTFTPED